MRVYPRDRLAVAVLLGIPLLFMLVWVFYPAAQSLYYSLTRWDGISDPDFVGLGNYAQMVEQPAFRTALANNVRFLLVFGVVSIVGGLALAVVVHNHIAGWRLYRSAFFLPIAVSFVVTGFVWRYMFSPEGVVNSVLAGAGQDGLARNWLGDPDVALWTIVVAAVWRQVGYVMLLYLAGLKGVDTQILDAAKVDGASALQTFRHVTFPALTASTTVVIAVTVIDSLRTFDIVWTMTQGGPFGSTEVLSTYMWREAFGFLRLGYGSAIAMTILLLAVFFIVLYLRRALAKEAA